MKKLSTPDQNVLKPDYLLNPNNYSSYIEKQIAGIVINYEDNNDDMVIKTITENIDNFIKQRKKYIKLEKSINDIDQQSYIDFINQYKKYKKLKKSINDIDQQIKNIMEDNNKCIRRLINRKKTDASFEKMTIFVQESINDAENKANKAEEKTKTDLLTGLHNRVALMKDFNEILTSPNKTEYQIAYFDLVDFKAVNDRYGHEAGDDILKIVANIIKENLGMDYRIGGDEFLIISKPDENLIEIAIKIQKEFKTAVEEYNKEKGKDIETDIRFGITSIREDDKPSAKDDKLHNCINRADIASYGMKTSEKTPKTGIMYNDAKNPDVCTYIGQNGKNGPSLTFAEIIEAQKLLEGREGKRRTEEDRRTKNVVWSYEI